MPRRGEQIDFTRRTALYRLFDAKGRLLYVGVAFDPEARWLTHKWEKEWWPEVAEKLTQWHATRTEALTAEASAIKAEKPLYNKKDSDVPSADPVTRRPGLKPPRIFRAAEETWDAFGEACASKGTNRADDLRRYMHAEIKRWRAEQRRIAVEERAADA